MDDAPNYSLYSLADLHDAARHLGKEKHPERYVLVMQEIQRREKKEEKQEGRDFTAAQPPEQSLYDPGGCLWALLRGCLSALLRFCAGAAVGGIGAILLWNIIYPPSGPNYGEGIGWGMAMLFCAFLAAIVGGVCAMFYNPGSK